MHRARQRSVAGALALALASFVAPSAWAFHAGATFDKPPGAGGSGAIYYTGSPLERGWKCTLCHLNPPGKIRLHIDQPELFNGGKFQYTPGQVYEFVVDLVGEHLGIASTHSNYNSLVVQVLDDNQLPIGNMLYADTEFYSGYQRTTIASANNSASQVGVTHWKFKWFAPMPTDGPDGGPPGNATMYFAVVDGNGADIGPNGTLTDPYGDDFFSVEVVLTQGPEMMGSRPPSDERTHRAAPEKLASREAPPGKGGPIAPALASTAAIAALGMAHRSRRRSRGRRRGR
jgi:hypothetical protein